MWEKKFKKWALHWHELTMYHDQWETTCALQLELPFLRVTACKGNLGKTCDITDIKCTLTPWLCLLWIKYMSKKWMTYLSDTNYADDNNYVVNGFFLILTALLHTSFKQMW